MRVTGRPFKVYSLLVLGIILGFTLSMMLQTLDLDSIRRSGRSKLQKVVDYASLDSAKRVEFSNLDEYEPHIDLGDYDYERLTFNSEDQSHGGPDIDSVGLQRARQDQRPDSMFYTVQRQDDSNHDERVATLPPAPDIPDDLKLKQLEYRSENWQGRNVRESKDGLPPNKLSDELPSRQTYVIAVITTVTQLMSQTLAIHGTWGPEAKQVIYFVGEVHPMPHLPHGMNVIQLEEVDDRGSAWEIKEFTVVKYLIDNYLDTVDWFVVVGDETYVVTDSLDKRLNMLDSSVSVFMGRAGEVAENGKSLLCSRNPGIVYSRGLFERLKPYLPLCWPGQGEMNSLSGCISVMGVKCTQAKEVSTVYSITQYWML